MTVTFDLLALGEGIGVAAVIVLSLLLLWLMFVNLRHWLASRKYEVGDRSAMRRRWQEARYRNDEAENTRWH